MLWEEVRKIYPDQYVKLQILKYHTVGNAKFVDDVALIRAIRDPKEATQELLKSKNGIIVSHTSNRQLKIHIRTLRGLRGIMAVPIPDEQRPNADKEMKDYIKRNKLKEHDSK